MIDHRGRFRLRPAAVEIAADHSSNGLERNCTIVEQARLTANDGEPLRSSERSSRLCDGSYQHSDSLENIGSQVSAPPSSGSEVLLLTVARDHFSSLHSTFRRSVM